MTVGNFVVCFYFILIGGVLAVLALPFQTHGGPFVVDDKKEVDVFFRSRRYAKPPSVPTAPLDINENIHHTLDEVTSILGTLGGATSQAVMGLTGISITDCAGTIKEQDLTTITCAQFIQKLSECDSLSHLKPLLQQAKQKYNKKPSSNKPCFSKKGKRQG